MSREQLILSIDFDGTLNTIQGLLQKDLIQVLKRAHEFKIPVVITTARDMRETINNVQGLLSMVDASSASIPEIKSKIKEKIKANSLQNALDQIKRLRLPTPRISTDFDPLLPAGEIGFYYQKLEQLMLALSDRLEHYECKSGEEVFNKFFAELGQLRDYLYPPPEGRARPPRPDFIREMPPHIQSSIEEEIKLQERRPAEQKPKHHQFLSLKRQLRLLPEIEVHVLHFDDSRSVNRGLGHLDMDSFEVKPCLISEIREDVPENKVTVIPIPFTQQEEKAIRAVKTFERECFPYLPKPVKWSRIDDAIAILEAYVEEKRKPSSSIFRIFGPSRAEKCLVSNNLLLSLKVLKDRVIPIEDAKERETLMRGTSGQIFKCNEKELAVLKYSSRVLDEIDFSKIFSEYEELRLYHRQPPPSLQGKSSCISQLSDQQSERAARERGVAEALGERPAVAKSGAGMGAG